MYVCESVLKSYTLILLLGLQGQLERRHFELIFFKKKNFSLGGQTRSTNIILIAGQFAQSLAINETPYSLLVTMVSSERLSVFSLLLFVSVLVEFLIMVC